MPTIFEKLNLKDQRGIVIINAPDSFEPELANLRNVSICRDLKNLTTFQFGLAFATTQAEVDRLLAEMPDQPSRSVRKLLRSPEGIDALIESWEGLREDLSRTDLRHWTSLHNDRAHQLTGRRAVEIPISRIQELSQAIWGDFSLIGDQEGAGLAVDARRSWARDRLIEGIDEEVAALRSCREALDLESFEQDRAEAGRRALFDMSKPAILARRYEAAAERGMFRALKELRQVETEAANNPPASPSNLVVPLGSFGEVAEAPVEPVEEPDSEWESDLEKVVPTISRPTRVERVEERAPVLDRGGEVSRFPSRN